MNRKNCLFVALAAGSAMSASALAQVTTGTVMHEQADGTLVRVPATFGSVEWTNGATVPSYGQRDVTVLDNLTGLFTNSTLQTLGTTHILDDFGFAPGPWAASATRVATSFQPSFFYSDWNGTTSPAYQLRLRFFNDSAYAATIGASMIPAGATEAGNIFFDFPAGFWDASKPGPGYISIRFFNPVALDITPGAEDLIFSGTGTLCEVSIHEPGNPAKFAWTPAAGATNPLGNAGLYIPAGENSTAPVQLFGLVMQNKPTSPGSAPSINYGRDINGDGTFTASTPIAGGGFTTPTDVRDTRTNAGRSYALAIQGNVVPPPPPVDVDLGCLSDGITNATIPSRAPGAFKTIKFCLKGDATDAQRRFLDVIGDTSDGTDFSVGIYNAATGALVDNKGSDDNSGDSVTGAPQLSFGVGRRAKPVSTAQPLDGRNGQLVAGTYFALVSGPAAGFGDGYIVSVPDVSLDAGGANTISFSTNTNAGALAASVAPDPADYLGSALTIPPSATVSNIQPNDRSVAWFTFNLCEDVGGAGSTEFLDIDFGTSTSTNPDTILFDSNGNLVGDSDNSGTSNNPALSYSDAAIAARVPAGAGMAPLAGQNGSLAAGTYYLAFGLSDVSRLVAGDRWHVRANSASSNPMSFNLNTNVDCVAGCPCAADYDLSGGTPDAGDIDAFFSDWLLGEAKADADCSGGTPDAGDIDVFFAQWLNGGC
jgi:hypothetical protein